MGLFSDKTNKTNLKIARETNQAQMELAQFQADQNLNLWNLNNEYNTPSAQMQRYQEAGLNPNLIYGEGSSSAGNSSSPAKGYEAPTLQRATVQNYAPQTAQVLLNGLSQAIAVKKQSAETDMIQQQTANLQVDNTYKELQVAYQNFRNSKERDEANMWRDILNAKRANLLGGARQSESSALTNDALRPLLVQQKEAEIDNLIETNDNLSFINKQLNPLRKQELVAKIANLYSQSELYHANSALSRANVELTESNISLNKERSNYMILQEESQYLENNLKKILQDSGINLKGSSIDRVAYILNQLMIKNGVNPALGIFQNNNINPFGGLLNQ